MFPLKMLKYINKLSYNVVNKFVLSSLFYKSVELKIVTCQMKGNLLEQARRLLKQNVEQQMMPKLNNNLESNNKQYQLKINQKKKKLNMESINNS